MNIFKKSIICAGFAIAFTGPAFAGGGGMTGGATEVTQLLNNGELLVQSATQAQQLKTQLQQAMFLTQNEIMTRWPELSQKLAQLGDIYQRSTVISSTMSGQASVLQRQYAGYDASSIKTALKQWSDNTRQLTNSAFEVTGLKMADFQSQAATLQNLSGLSHNAQGQMQAIQAGNQIASALAEQMLHLNQIQTHSMQMQAAAIAQKNETEASRRDMLNQMGLGNVDSTPLTSKYTSARPGLKR